MNRIVRFLVVIALCAGLPAPLAQAAASRDAQRPELAYLKQVNQWRPPSDPQLIFLLMAQFANAGRHTDGIDYFNGVLKRFEAELDDTYKGSLPHGDSVAASGPRGPRFPAQPDRLGA